MERTERRGRARTWAAAVASIVLSACVQAGPAPEQHEGEASSEAVELGAPVVLKAPAATECEYPLCSALTCESLIDVVTRYQVAWEVGVGEDDALVECQHSGCEGEEGNPLCHDGLWCQRPRLYACPEGWAGDE